MTFLKFGINGCAALAAVLVCFGGCSETAQFEKISTNISDTKILKDSNVIDRNYKALSEAINQHTTPPKVISRGGDMTDDECCTELGQTNECWNQDAQDDQAVITCTNDADCASDDSKCVDGRCTCTTDDDCDVDGACSESGICGPSWCNGYLICSCWGGCEWWHSNKSLTPVDWAINLGKYCCEGNYPEGDTELIEIVSGYLSNDPNCGSGCFNDEDCLYLSSECKDGVCDVATGICTVTFVSAGTVCTNEDETTYPPETYPESCYNFYCGGHDGLDPAGPTGPTVAANNGVCEPAFDSDGLELNNTCNDPISLGSFNSSGNSTADEGTDPTSTTLQIDGNMICAENNYEAGGDDCNNLGDSGRDLIYSFTYDTNVATQYQLRGFVVQLEADFNAAIYISDTCPVAGVAVTTVPSNRCLAPYEDSPEPEPWESATNIWGNGLYDPVTIPPLYQQCCDPDDPECYKWCTRGASWTYPDAPVPCNDDILTGVTTCDLETAFPDQNMASAVIYPKGLPDGAATSATHTVYLVVDGASGDQNDFTLTVKHLNWTTGPVERINDDPRVYDVTSAPAAGTIFMGSLADAVNSTHASSGLCGGYDCTDPTVWAGKSTGAGGVGTCHPATTANQYWPNKEYFKIHRPAGSAPQKYCITTDESISGAANLVLDVIERNINGTGKAIGPVFAGAGMRYDDTATCHSDNDDPNAFVEITAQPDVLYLIGVSQYTALTTEPCSGNCNYNIKVEAAECPPTTPPEVYADRHCNMGSYWAFDSSCFVTAPGGYLALPGEGKITVSGASGAVTRTGTVTVADKNCFGGPWLNPGGSLGSYREHIWIIEKNNNVNNLRVTVSGGSFAAFGCDNGSGASNNGVATFNSSNNNAFALNGGSGDPAIIAVAGNAWGGGALPYNYTIKVEWF